MKRKQEYLWVYIVVGLVGLVLVVLSMLKMLLA